MWESMTWRDFVILTQRRSSRPLKTMMPHVIRNENPAYYDPESALLMDSKGLFDALDHDLPQAYRKSALQVPIIEEFVRRAMCRPRWCPHNRNAADAMTKFKGAHSEPLFTLLRTGMYTLQGEKSELADRAILRQVGTVPRHKVGSSGDDWQGADVASGELPDGSLCTAGCVRRAGGAENFVHEEYVSASCFNRAKQGFVFRCGGRGLGYYQDRKNEFACEKRAVLSQWPPYFKALGDMAPGWCKDLERAEQFKWTISLNDAIFGVGETGRTRRSRRRPKRCKRHRRKGQDLVHVPEFVDAEDDLHRKGARW